MVTPSGRSTSMVMAAITVPDDQESSDPVPTVDQHLSRTVAHRGHSGKPQKPWCSHLTPEEPIHFLGVAQSLHVRALRLQSHRLDRRVASITSHPARTRT